MRKKSYFALGVTAATILVMRLWPHNGSMIHITFGILSPLLNLDGENSYDAYLAEAFILIWTSLAILTFAAVRLSRSLLK